MLEANYLYERLIDLNQFSISISMRQDGDNYTEGMTIGSVLMMKMGRKSWLQPGVTYTPHVLDGMGMISVPKVTATEGEVTDLCVDGNVGGANEVRVPILINKKVSAVFDGCFTAVGIADKIIQRALNNAKVRKLRITYEKYIEGIMVQKGKAATTARGELSARGYLAKLKTEYYKVNTDYPTFALVSLDFMDELDAEMALRETVQGDAKWVRGGDVAMAAGILVIPAEIPVPVILATPDRLPIVTPQSAAQLADGIIGGVDSEAGFSFGSGFGFFQEINAKAGTAHTYVHKFFGFDIVDTDGVLVAPVTPA